MPPCYKGMIRAGVQYRQGIELFSRFPPPIGPQRSVRLVWVENGTLRSSSPTPYKEQRYLQANQVSPRPIQPELKYFQRHRPPFWAAFHHPYCKKCLTSL